jgi:hypothetical protein
MNWMFCWVRRLSVNLESLIDDDSIRAWLNRCISDGLYLYFPLYTAKEHLFAGSLQQQWEKSCNHFLNLRIKPDVACFLFTLFAVMYA